MDYYNFNNAEFDYSVPSTSGGFYEYPFFGHASAVEQTNDAVLGNLENCWDAILQPSPMIGTSTNIWEAPESEPAAEETPLLSRFEDYSQPSHITCLDPRLLTVDQQPQPEYTGLFNQTYSPNEVRDSSEVSTTIQPLGSVPPDYRGTNQNEPCTSTFDWVRTGAGQPSNYPLDALLQGGASSQYHPSPGPDRMGQTSAQRFKPYGTSRTRETGRENAEAGPSTLLLSQTRNPTGGLTSETVADAATNQTNTEQDEVPTTKKTRLPNGQGKPRGGRKQEQADALELRHLVKRWKGFTGLPSRNEAVALALLYIRTVRPAVYQSPHLERGQVQPLPAASVRAEVERKRRKADQMLCGALSRHYRLERDVEAWNRPLLLKEVIEDLKYRHPPPELYNR